MKIRSDPQIKRKTLTDELKILTRQLKEKELIQGEAYRDTGNGWHENPTYEALVNDALVLKSQIRGVKEELEKLTHLFIDK